MSRERANLTSLLDQLEDSVEGKKVTLGEVIDIFEARGFGPLLIIPGLIAAIPPIGAIPGVPSTCGILIALIAVQLIFGRKSPWLPSKLSNVSFSRDKLKRFTGKAKRVTKWVDKLLKPRFKGLTHEAAKKVIAFIAVLLGLSMIPLELVPFAGAIPASTLVLLGLGLTAEDGLLIVIGFCVALFGFGGVLFGVI
ncbi:exopolysaccharide biosynthesis protein [Phytohalomonas tamaricis]|uniref:exopolysaccharide biosynthesis protein n=1 Tax=Phytohalomonas tamaricis TaxID=2081032 RepID=UPI000D0BDE8C|nr:exopolysaccharide biosynthesis protein [Phytohalomonas tamaricis]